MSDLIKAMIMSAGMGSRLEPLTLCVPKPLVPVANKPVMSILFESLVKIGIKDVICNAYYLADQIIDKYKNNDIGINFNYIKETELSGTAGGVKKCQFFFEGCKTFVVLSADGLTNADLKKGIEIHKESGAIATIGIKSIPKLEVSHFGVVVVDEKGFVKEFQEKPSVEDAKSNLINTGIYIFDYSIFGYIPENTFYDFAKNVFPKLLEKKAINTFEVNEYWSDIGTLDQYKQATQDLYKGLYSFNHSEIIKTGEGAYISEGSKISENVKFVGFSTVGKNSYIGKNTIIENSIIWDDVLIGENLYIKDSVIPTGCKIEANVISEILPAKSILKECLKSNT